MPPSSTLHRPFPTLRYVAAPFRSCFGSRRRALITAAMLLAIAAAPVVWWNLQLMGLPDVGDPFDGDPLRSMTIPDDDNAFVLYRQAVDRLVSRERTLQASRVRAAGVLPMVPGGIATRSPGPAGEEKIDWLAAWSKADPRVRGWVEANREAMDLYRRAAGRPDFLDPGRPRAEPLQARADLEAFRSLHFLALLEASRLEEAGDMAGAWGWYRTALRGSYLFARYGTQSHRFLAHIRRNAMLGRLAAWSSDRRTTPAMVRRALDDVLACGALAPSDTYTITIEYEKVMRLLDSPGNPGREPPMDDLFAVFGAPEYQVTPEQVQAVLDVLRFCRREPERSRRVIRLAVANWLAYHDLPPDRRPKPDPNVPGPLQFYAFGPEVPAAARALSPVALDGWLATTFDATPILKEWNPAATRVKEVRGYRAMVVLLASELYRRDRGVTPPSDEAVVGPYLKELPDDGLPAPLVQPDPAALKASRAKASTGRE